MKTTRRSKNINLSLRNRALIIPCMHYFVFMNLSRIHGRAQGNQWYIGGVHPLGSRQPLRGCRKGSSSGFRGKNLTPVLWDINYLKQKRKHTKSDWYWLFLISKSRLEKKSFKEVVKLCNDLPHDRIRRGWRMCEPASRSQFLRNKTKIKIK